MVKIPNREEKLLLHEIKDIIETLNSVGVMLEKENATKISKESAKRLMALAGRLSEIIEDEFWGWIERD